MAENKDVIMDEVANELIACQTTDRSAHISFMEIKEEIDNIGWKQRQKVQGTGSYLMKSLSTGSYAEGMPRFVCGDHDIMIQIPIPTVCWQPYETDDNSATVIAEQFKDDPAYLMLKVHVIDNKFLNQQLQKSIDSDGYLNSSDFIKEYLAGFMKGKETFEIHGPSIASILLNSDAVLCLSCQSWPSITDKYFTRKRPSNWPSKELLNKISCLDCHVVAVGRQNSLSKDAEWRLSFSIAEKKLIHNMPEAFANCMVALKAVMKHSYQSSTPKPYCSYYLKTACLWMSERIVLENTMNSMRKVLDWLTNCYQHRNLPHYFIPEQNLIGQLSGKLCDNVCKTLTVIKGNLWAKVISSIEDGQCNVRHIINALICNRLKITNVNTHDDYAVLEAKLLNHPMTTKCLAELLDDLKDVKSDSLIRQIDRWMSQDFSNQTTLDLIENNANISEIITPTEKIIMSVIENIEDIVMKGYDGMFRTKLYRLLGELITNVLACLRQKCSAEDMLKYQNKALHYYMLGGDLIYPNGFCDYGVGHHGLVVKHHYLMNNDAELIKELKEFDMALPNLREKNNRNDTNPCVTPWIVVHTKKGDDLSYRAWAVDALFQHHIKYHNYKERHFLDLLTIVYYINCRVNLNKGKVDVASMRHVEYMKTFLREFPSTEILIKIIESLIGLSWVMKIIHSYAI